MRNKMKQWRRPKYSNGNLIKQQPRVRRREKSQMDRLGGGMSSLLAKLFSRIGIKTVDAQP